MLSKAQANKIIEEIVMYSGLRKMKKRDSAKSDTPRARHGVRERCRIDYEYFKKQV